MTKLANHLYNLIFFSLGHLRASFWRLFTKKMGKNAVIMSHCTLGSPHGITIGDNFFCNRYSNLGGGGGLIIGNDVQIGCNVNVMSVKHNYDHPTIPINQQGFTPIPTIIEDNVWLGANVVVMPGVTIHQGAIIGANAVVTKDAPPHTILGGIPARPIKKRKLRST
jgi:acetyltransferase-like isoleucine patch superfamily enzyme